MGAGISSCYSFIEGETPFQNSFELIGDASGDMKPQMGSGDENKNDKRKMFDNDYENFIKSRNEGIPVSTNRA